MFDATFARPRRRGTLTLSIGIHALLGVALVVGPLAAVEEPPEPGERPIDFPFTPPPSDEPIRVKIVVADEPTAGAARRTADAPRDAVARPRVIAEPSDIPPLDSETVFMDDGPAVIGPADAPATKGPDGPVNLQPSGPAETIYRPGTAENVTEPVPVFMPRPNYPDLALKIHAQGVVILEAVIGRDGHVRDVRVLRGVNPLLDKAAQDAVLQWTYEPARIGTRAVAVYLTVTVTFGLK